jgi:hypothetical protein
MKKNLTDLVLILDRSGSMGDIWNDAVGGMKTFIEEQKKVPGEAYLTMVLFDTPPFDTVFNREKITEVNTSVLDKFHARGSTALLKAVSDTVDAMGQKYAALPEGERPERVLLVIQTDGEENSSNGDWHPRLVEKKIDPLTKRPFNPIMLPVDAEEQPTYTKAKLKAKLDLQRNSYNWEVIFLGADENAFAEGASMGSALNFQYNATRGGTQALYDTVSASAASYRTKGTVDNQADLGDLKNKK